MIKKSPSTLLRLSRETPGELMFRKLNGLFCFYKPPDMDLMDVFGKLRQQLVSGLNQMPCRPIENIVKVDDETSNITISKNLADSVEALGCRYTRKDFRLDFLHPLGEHDSGVVIGSINDSSDLITKVKNMRLMRVYELKGRLGVCTHDFTPYGRLVDRAKYNSVTKSKIDRIMASTQAVYQREMFKHFGLGIDSQQAFDVASRGLLRPKSTSTPPIIYSIKCTELDQPYFKIEIHTINETMLFLKGLVHDIGLRLKAYAICVNIRRMRDGFMSYDDPACLAINDWNLEKIAASTQIVTSRAREYMIKYKDSELIGQARNDSPESENNSGNDVRKASSCSRNP